MLTQPLQRQSLCGQCLLAAACFSDTCHSSSVHSGIGQQIYQRGNLLFSMGDNFDFLYILRSGSAKAYINTSNGEEQITSFFHPGDVLGMDGFDSDQHVHSLKFLETSSVCRVSKDELDNLLATTTSVRQGLLKNLSHALVDEQNLLFTINRLNSEQKLAKFILELSSRFSRRGLSGNLFDLSMSRSDIANFLGMAIETVSRLLGKMQQEGLIVVNRRQVRIVDIAQLRQYTEQPDEQELTMLANNYSRMMHGSIRVNQLS